MPGNGVGVSKMMCLQTMLVDPAKMGTLRFAHPTGLRGASVIAHRLTFPNMHLTAGLKGKNGSTKLEWTWH